MNSLIGRSTVLVAVAIASLLAATPARAQSDERAIVAAVTTFLDGIRTRDTSLMRSTVVSGATLVPVGGPTGLGAPSLAASSLSLNARAQDERAYSYGPVTEMDYIHVEYGHFDEYMAWVTSTWVPTMEAAKKAGLIIGYKVFQASPKSPDQPNVYLEITFKNMAAYAGDIGDQADAFEAVTEKVICNSACQNQARVHRNEIRKVLGTEVTRELVFK
ncbi:MAG TPA: hypothetical protein VK617_12775 [Gemmatimonadaceae bacterium]|nr:hypothetical protein [Gemmatimonadaceae bacterium]